MAEGAKRSDSILTPLRIIEAAEETLRRFGPEKTTVVDVARALGVSHGSVYRHFPSKVALREAVVRRWLDASIPSLEAIASEQGPVIERIHRWLLCLVAIKRERAASDPELFAAYYSLALGADLVVGDHMEQLCVQLAQILEEGVQQGDLNILDIKATAQAILNATARFHNPAFSKTWISPKIDDAFEQVWRLLERGIVAPSMDTGAD